MAEMTDAERLKSANNTIDFLMTQRDLFRKRFERAEKERDEAIAQVGEVREIGGEFAQSAKDSLKEHNTAIESEGITCHCDVCINLGEDYNCMVKILSRPAPEALKRLREEAKKNEDAEVEDRFRFLTIGIGKCESIEEAVKFVKQRADDTDVKAAEAKRGKDAD